MGLNMKGGFLRWPLRPSRATCALIAVQRSASISAQCIVTGRASIDNRHFGILGQRSKVSTITIVSPNPNPLDLKITDVIPTLHHEGGCPYLAVTKDEGGCLYLAVTK